MSDLGSASLPEGRPANASDRGSQTSAQRATEDAALPDHSWHVTLLQLWRKFLKTKDVSIDDDFFEKGGDSLLAIDLQLEIQRLTGLVLPESFLFEAPTVRALAKRLARLPGAPRAPAIRTVPGEVPSPLIFFHGDEAEDGPFIEHLVRSLAPELQVLPRALAGADGGALPSSIEDIAAGQLPPILAAQPQGPYRMGGRRDGALVALEAARLLAAAGCEVELVAMVDPAGIALSARPLSALLAWVAGKTRRDGVMASYAPSPLQVPLLIFATAQEAQAWRRVSPDIEVVSLPGSRSDWVTSQCAELVRRLRARLQSTSDAKVAAGQGVAKVHENSSHRK